jgi:hypothetical protein
VTSELSALTSGDQPAQNPDSANSQAPGAAANAFGQMPTGTPANSGLKEIVDQHE